MKLTAMALMVFALGLPSFADVPWTDVETVTAYLTNMLPAAVSDVRVYASSEAVPLVDRYFANLPEEFEDDPEGNCPDPKIRLMRMKHFLENEFAFVYSFSTSVSNLESVAAGKVSGDVSVYVFQPRVFSRFNIVTDPPRVMIGQRHLDNAEYVVLSKADGRCYDRLTDDEPTREGQPLPFKNRKLETNVCVPTSEADDNDDKVEPEAVVVADVEGAFFDTVRNMNPSCVKEVSPTSHALISPVATYRVELLVRRVEDGSFPYERLAFTVDPERDRALYEDWPFYRGMTLGVALCRIDGALRIRRVWPVLPCPPLHSGQGDIHGFAQSRPRRALWLAFLAQLPRGGLAPRRGDGCARRPVWRAHACQIHSDAQWNYGAVRRFPRLFKRHQGRGLDGVRGGQSGLLAIRLVRERVPSTVPAVEH